MNFLNRTIELYTHGGLTELSRGIRDYLRTSIDTNSALAYIYTTKTLDVDGVKVKFHIDTVEDIIRSRGHGELGVLTDFKRELNPQDTFFDIGANVGTYSILAEKVGANARAFEPGSDACERFYKNAYLNHVSISLHQIALSDENGQSILSNEKRSGIRKLSDSGDGEIVPTRRADDLYCSHPDVIKIDVEGSELDVIDGMTETLLNCRCCYVEIHDGVDKSEVQNRLYECGLSLTREFDRDIIKFTT